jgi:hypothetical protein
MMVKIFLHLLSMHCSSMMAHVLVQQALCHSFQYKYHYPKIKYQPPVLQYWKIKTPIPGYKGQEVRKCQG